MQVARVCLLLALVPCLLAQYEDRYDDRDDDRPSYRRRDMERDEEFEEPRRFHGRRLRRDAEEEEDDRYAPRQHYRRRDEQMDMERDEAPHVAQRSPLQPAQPSVMIAEPLPPKREVKPVQVQKDFPVKNAFHLTAAPQEKEKEDAPPAKMYARPVPGADFVEGLKAAANTTTTAATTTTTTTEAATQAPAVEPVKPPPASMKLASHAPSENMFAQAGAASAPARPAQPAQAQAGQGPRVRVSSLVSGILSSVLSSVLTRSMVMMSMEDSEQKLK